MFLHLLLKFTFKHFKLTELDDISSQPLISHVKFSQPVNENVTRFLAKVFNLYMYHLTFYVDFIRN